MTRKFTIPGRLDGHNEYTNANRTNRYGGASMKRKNQDMCVAAILEGLQGWKTTKQIDVKVVWYEPNGRRDLDNIGAGIKFILDALVECGVIPDDSQKYVRSRCDFVCVDRDNPRIEVEISEVEHE